MTLLFISKPVLDAIGALGIPAFLVLWYILAYTPRERKRMEAERKEDNAVRDKLLDNTLAQSKEINERLDLLTGEIRQLREELPKEPKP